MTAPRSPRRRRLATALLAPTLATGLVLGAAPATAAPGPAAVSTASTTGSLSAVGSVAGVRSAATSSAPRARAGRVRLRQTSFSGRADWRSGSMAGVRVRKGRLVLGKRARDRRFDGRGYRAGTWTSPWVEPGFSLTELIPSWEGRTRGDSWVEVKVRGRSADGRTSSWDTMARWTLSEKWVRRTTLGSQTDDLARVNVDTWQAPAGLASWQVRVTLLRADGSGVPVSLERVGAIASRLPDRDGVSTSRPTRRVGTVLDVPAYSQMVHSGHSPQWGGGGEAWCSPTSTSMVLGFHDALPPARQYGWVGAGHPEPWVDHAARKVYDHGYDGAGNWAFNTAWAGTRVDTAYVTRFRNLRRVERLVSNGVPVVVSVRFGRGELDGAPISSTNGHLLVIVGFRDNGDVVVNDPAAQTNAGVRRTYDRGQLEDVWLPTSGGLAYVIRT